MKAAVISEQGPRPAMEDAYFLDTDFGGRGWVFGGVYDGHGGAFAARYAARNLHERFLIHLLAGAPPSLAFVRAYETISEELKHQESGTTAVTFLIKDSFIYTANAGDARAILVSESGAAQLTVDHRLDNREERERILGMGGTVIPPYAYRGYAGIMPTRTLGDEYFKDIGVIARPDVFERAIGPDDLAAVAACDGLFDFMGNGEVAELARRFAGPAALLDALRAEILGPRFGSDNLTIIAVCLRD